MTSSNVNCENFDALFLDYLEGTLDADVRASAEVHLRECVRCAGLVRDIDRIRNDASALADLAPSRDLWAGIESRIAAPVVPLVARPAAQRRLNPAWLGIAAAALIVSTAGITYLVTARSIDRSPVTAAAPTTPAPSGSTETAPATSGVELGNQLAAVPTGAAAETQRSNSSGLAPQTGDAGVARLVRYEPLRSDVVYGREIAMLQSILRTRRTQLDSGTVAIIERNLSIIDAAIAQSKEALAKDPASQLLSDQLTHALDKKVELLRTAAMLPSST